MSDRFERLSERMSQLVREEAEEAGRHLGRELAGYANLIASGVEMAAEAGMARLKEFLRPIKAGRRR
jgi:hypothetical protein